MESPKCNPRARSNHIVKSTSSYTDPLKETNRQTKHKNKRKENKQENGKISNPNVIKNNIQNKSRKTKSGVGGWEIRGRRTRR